MEYRLFFEVKYDNIKVSKKLSDLCTDGLWGKGDRIFAEYDLTENVLYVKDLEGNELGKYIENNRMIVFKIQGIKAEKKKIYEEWKKWNTGIDNPPEDMLRIIYFPVKYKESLCACCKVGGHSCDQSGAVWYVINEIIVEEVLQNVDMKKIFLEYKILPKWINIEMGVFPIINVGSDRFMEYYNDGWGSPYVKENETYWHGIRLDLGKLAPYINIIGVDCGM